jgi:nicotinate phosphoribosyltransferase
MVAHLREAIQSMSELRLSDDEHGFLKRCCPFLGPGYLAFLRNYRYDPEEVQVQLRDGQLELTVHGLWHRTILWEVPLMAMISELFFRECRANWDMEGQLEKIRRKAQRLADAGCSWADFGTRRRRSYNVQEMVVRESSQFPQFVGTSNVHLARRYNVKPIGTMAHEWIQAHAVLQGLRRANRHALHAWMQVYGGFLGIALTDTYTTPSFWKDFDRLLARQFDGVRQDSGDPLKFVDQAIENYQRLGIDPMSKTVVFSDGLNTDKVIELAGYCRNKTRCSFGIGTHLTNDFDDPALNMVIKLVALDGIPVVKLSDDPGKVSGDRDAVRVARYVHCGVALDEPLVNHLETELSRP